MIEFTLVFAGTQEVFSGIVGCIKDLGQVLS